MHPVLSIAGVRRFRCVAVGLFGTAFGLATVGAMAGTVQLVRDINTTIIPASSFPQSLGTVGGKMLFGATDSTGAGLWSTDGTAAGTQLLQRLNGIGVEGHSPQPNFLPNGTGAYFVSADGAGTSTVWFTDGSSAGTRQVAVFTSNTTAPVSLKTMLGNTLIFSAYDANTVQQMYATDGTAAGTHALTSIVGQNASVLDGFILAGNKFYFVAEDTSYAHQIWVSDGTAAGTHMVTNGLGVNSVGSSATDNPVSFQLIGNLVLYTSSGLLWTIDITTDTIGAVTVGSGTPGFGPPSVLGSGLIENMGGFALFLGSGSVFPSNLELWRSDGTTAGTYKVADVASGASSNVLQFDLFGKVGNRVIYVADDGQNGQQLWSSDGTAANTVRLTNATQPANSFFQVASPLATIANLAYVTISDGASTTTRSVWQTDGTAAGTRRVGGLPAIDQGVAGGTQVTGDAATLFFTVYDATGAASLYKYAPAANTSILLKAGMTIFNGDEFAYSNGRLFFANSDPIIGDEPWVSDGTVAGTQLIEDIYPQTTDSGSNPDEFVQFGGRLVFAADDGISGRELWISDGTPGGTKLLADINPGAASSYPNDLFTANGALYFFATDATGVSRFMRLASVGANVEVLAALSPQPSSLIYACAQGNAAALGTQIFFPANDGQSGLELWTSDGTAAGTHLVADISAGISDSYPCNLTVFGSRLFFSAVGPAGYELWSSDGSTAGTVQVADINPGPLSSFANGLVVFDGALYFAADDGVHGTELWKSDGSAAGTVLVADVVSGIDASYPAPLGMLNGKLLFEVFIPSSQTTIGYVGQLWTTDGTANGTAQLTAVAGSFLANPMTNGKQVFYAGQDSAGVEPWVSDGTAAGTHILKDINPAGDSNPSWFEDFNGTTLFEITEPSSGEQLWRSDGTAAGTIQVSGMPPQPIPVFPPTPARHRLTVGQKFFFSAVDPARGTELFALTNNAPVATADSAASTNDAAVTIDVLANDTDSDGTLDPGSIQIVTNAGHGNAVIVAGHVAYTPSSGFAGTDTFTYTVNDNQGTASAPATVTITVTAPASPPPPPPPPPSKSGGGAVDVLTLLSLFTLLALGLRRSETESR
jgi:ELWxxDGT repeat protein